jgi:MoxR-like ATPase
MSDVEFLLNFTTDAYRAKNEGRPANIMLKGDTQGGKTFLVEVLAVKWAEAMGLPKPMPIFTLSGSSGITDYDLYGQTTSYTDPMTGREMLVWLPGMADLAAQVGGILYLDEVNAMGERVTSSLHPLTDHRHHFINRNKPVFKGGQFMPDAVTADLDLWIIGTYNEGYRGMGEMNEAFINRFRHLVWDYDQEVEQKLIPSPAIRLLGDALRTARSANQVRTPVGTAALQRVQEDVDAFGIAAAMEVFTGMFKPNERPVVQSIIEDRSIFLMLQEEARQDKLNAKAGD